MQGGHVVEKHKSFSTYWFKSIKEWVVSYKFFIHLHTIKFFSFQWHGGSLTTTKLLQKQSIVPCSYADVYNT